MIVYDRYIYSIPAQQPAGVLLSYAIETTFSRSPNYIPVHIF